MTERTPEILKYKEIGPYVWGVYFISEIDNNDTVTVVGADPNETVFAKAVRSTDHSEEVVLAITNNVIQIDDADVDDYRLHIFFYGLKAP